MVYESDFYTTRRPYRTTPSYSTYTVSSVPSRQIRVLPGLGKVHIVHTYDRIVPYVGHKRLTVVTTPPKVWSTTPSVLRREYDWIENKVRPWVAYSPTSHYLNSSSAVRIVYYRYPIGTSTTCSCMMYPTYIPSYTNYYRIYRPAYLDSDYWPYFRTYRYFSPYWPIYRPFSFYYYPTYRYLNYIDDYPAVRAIRLQRIFDDETRMIRAQSAALMRKIHDPVPRAPRTWPITSVRYGYEDIKSIPFRWSSDNYIHKMLTVSPSNKVEYMTYYTEPVRKSFGQGHLASVFYAGDRPYSRRRDVWYYEDPVKNDIQLLSYYIAKFRQEKATGAKEPTKVPLPPNRPSRRFTSSKRFVDDPQSKEILELREARAARLARIYAADDIPATPSATVDEVVKAKKKQDEQRLAEEKALAEEQARKEAQAKKEEEARKAEQAKKEEAARKAELARQEELAAQAAAERAAELERQAELARQEELAKQAELERLRKEEEERARQEEERRREEEARAEEERQALQRLEEIARQAEEEREAELARQAEELAELARQEAELAEQAKKQAEEEELARQEAELAELERQEAELAELERKEKELAELAEIARQEAEAAKKDAEQAELARQEEELAELERQQAELDALEAEAKALEAEYAPEAAAEEEKAEEEEEAAPEEQAAHEEEAAPEEEAEPEETAAEEEVAADDDGHVSADDAEPEVSIDEE